MLSNPAISPRDTMSLTRRPFVVPVSLVTPVSSASWPTAPAVKNSNPAGSLVATSAAATIGTMTC